MVVRERPSLELRPAQPRLAAGFCVVLQEEGRRALQHASPARTQRSGALASGHDCADCDGYRSSRRKDEPRVQAASPLESQQLGRCTHPPKSLSRSPHPYPHEGVTSSGVMPSRYWGYLESQDLALNLGIQVAQHFDLKVKLTSPCPAGGRVIWYILSVLVIQQYSPNLEIMFTFDIVHSLADRYIPSRIIRQS